MAQVEARRQKTYQLYLRGLPQHEIAKQVQVSQPRVSQFLAQMRERNVKWFEAHEDPKERRKALYKEVADQYRDVLMEQWKLFEKADKLGLRMMILSGVTRTLDGYRNMLGLVVPSLDQAWIQDQMRKIDEATKKLEEDRLKGPEAAYAKWNQTG